MHKSMGFADIMAFGVKVGVSFGLVGLGEVEQGIRSAPIYLSDHLE